MAVVIYAPRRGGFNSVRQFESQSPWFAKYSYAMSDAVVQRSRVVPSVISGEKKKIGRTGLANPWRSRHRNDRLIFHLKCRWLISIVAGSLRGCTHVNQSVRLERPRSTQLQRCAALGTVFFLSGRISKRAFRYRNSPRRTPLELFLRRCSALLLVSSNASLTGLLEMLTEKMDFLVEISFSRHTSLCAHEIRDARHAVLSFII